MPTTQCLRGTCEVVLAETIAGGLMSKVRETITKIHKGGAIATKPRLAAFLANNDPFAVKYAEWSKKTCEEK
jgi:methylenetetrahydrofolate dehydrogenase (NAD+)